MKITISSGHGKHVAGAVGLIDEVTEARRVVNRVAKHLKAMGYLSAKFHEDKALNKTDNLNNIWKFHNATKRTLDVSVHFNAGGGHGTEVLYKTEQRLASNVSLAISKSGGFTNRGAKHRDDLGFLNYTDMPAVLIEVCFVDSAFDVAVYKKNFDKLCIAIAESLTGKKLKAEVK